MQNDVLFREGMRTAFESAANIQPTVGRLKMAELVADLFDRELHKAGRGEGIQNYCVLFFFLFSFFFSRKCVCADSPFVFFFLFFFSSFFFSSFFLLQACPHELILIHFQWIQH